MHYLASKHIQDLEKCNKELQACVVQEQAELERLRFLNRLSDNGLSPGGLDVPVSPRS
jgi:hypothetical protein